MKPYFFYLIGNIVMGWRIVPSPKPVPAIARVR